jgi:hypothetical protein
MSLFVEALRKRDSTANYDELRNALNEESSPILDSWVEEHLGPETLLTREELSL